MITEKELEKHGYKKYSPSCWDNDCVKDVFQKAVVDDKGNRKYFLDWRKWDFGKYNLYDFDKPSYEGMVQLETINNQTINITLFAGWELKDAEFFMKRLFDTGWFKKYDDEEENDDDDMTRTWVVHDDGSLGWE